MTDIGLPTIIYFVTPAEFKRPLALRLISPNNDAILSYVPHIFTWEKLNEVYANDGTIRGTIASKVKGGFSVDIGHPAFLPGSQVDLRPVRDMDSLIGTEHEFKILKYDRFYRSGIS